MKKSHQIAICAIAAFIIAIALLTGLNQSPPQPEKEVSTVLGETVVENLNVNSSLISINPSANASFLISYRYTITNTTGDRVFNISALSNLKQSFGSLKFSVIKTESAVFSMNNTYNGNSVKQMLSGNNKLDAGQSADIILTVKLIPGDNNGPFENHIFVSGLIDLPEDQSENQTGNADGENNGEPDENETTPTTPTPTTSISPSPSGTPIPTTTTDIPTITSTSTPSATPVNNDNENSSGDNEDNDNNSGTPETSAGTAQGTASLVFEIPSFTPTPTFNVNPPLPPAATSPTPTSTPLPPWVK